MSVAINAWFWNRPNVGLGQYVKWLVWGLLQCETELQIILVAPQPFQPGPQAQALFGRFSETVNPKNLTFLVKPTPFPNQRSHLSRLWFEQVTFPKVCRTLKPDIIHVPYYGAPLRPVKPTIITAHDLIPLLLPEYRRQPILRLYGRLIAATLPKADLLITPSQASRADLYQHLPIDPNRIRAIYQAPAPIFEKCHRQASDPLHLKYNLPTHYILYVGGYEKRKNVETLIHAFHQAQPYLPPNTGLILAGQLPQKDTNLQPDPRPLIQQLKLEKYVHLPGYIPEADLPHLYRTADLFVYPSRCEGFGFPVLEAMACGTAVLTTTAAALPEIAAPAAALVPSDDIGRMAEQIIHLMTDRKANHNLVQSGLEHVKQFTWQKTAAQTIQAYTDIINNSPIHQFSTFG